MKNLNGLKISLCQMKVEPGKPDLNAAYIIAEIEEAKKRNIDIIVFPEMCVTGYIVGDIFEDDFFIEDVLAWNKKIVEATLNSDVAVVFGTVTASYGKKGEDGRQRLHNTAVVARNGKILKQVAKSLQPNYRFFNDDKHFYSSREIAEETAELLRKENKKKREKSFTLHDLLKPLKLEIRGKTLSLGVILCEDMWHNDYALNPTKILVKKGAELIINISASPWTWRKNQKRHQVVKDLLSECKVPFVYVNNTGAQNTGKNIIVFDGSSTVYNKKGEIIFEIAPYVRDSHDFTFKANPKPLKVKPKNDTEELYNAMLCATRSIIPPDKKVLVGLSGGIDSAVVCAHLVDAIGKKRVIAVNMPVADLNSQKTKDMAQTIARNLGVEYKIIPIAEVVETVCKLTGIKPKTLAYENVQARTRGGGAILSALAQQLGAWYVCCSNKTEIAFGYGTLYGDIAGSYAPLGDLVKREVRQIADYINKVRFKREVIPEKCIHQVPTAELKPGQKDPFDYGDLDRRGYHDEVIRAYTEFRKNPEWLLELYIKGELESTLLLERGTISRLFPTARDFVNDLRHWWQTFHGSYFKRVQCPPIPIFSKRAFGRDLEESLMAPHFTRRYKYLENYVLGQMNSGKQKIAIFGGSMNPPSGHHKLIVERLTKIFDKVILIPCGIRKDKPSTKIATPAQRKEMTRLAFQNTPKTEIDFYDLDNDVFSPNWDLQERYAKLYPKAEIWFAVGPDIISGGRDGKSEIHRIWKNGKGVWENLNFIVISQPGEIVELPDLPPKSMILEMEVILGRSTTIRERIKKGKSVKELVEPEVAEYIEKEQLYR